MGKVGMYGERVKITRGPFDPGGQPQVDSPHPLVLGLFAWNLTGGATISKAVQADPARYRDFWHWDTARYLVQFAERIGFEFQVPFGRWLGHGGPTRFNMAFTRSTLPSLGPRSTTYRGGDGGSTL